MSLWVIQEFVADYTDSKDFAEIGYKYLIIQFYGVIRFFLFCGIRVQEFPG